MCQVVEIKPLGLIVSLPDQLIGHIPITQITSQLTKALEAEQFDDSSQEDNQSEAGKENTPTSPPQLSDMFHTGQFLYAIVTAVRPAGTTEGFSVLGFSRDHYERASMRVELSLVPDTVNIAVEKTDLCSGYVSSSMEDLCLYSQQQQTADYQWFNQ